MLPRIREGEIANGKKAGNEGQHKNTGGNLEK